MYLSKMRDSSNSDHSVAHVASMWSSAVSSAHSGPHCDYGHHVVSVELTPTNAKNEHSPRQIPNRARNRGTLPEKSCSLSWSSHASCRISCSPYLLAGCLAILLCLITIGALLWHLGTLAIHLTQPSGVR